MTDFKFKFNFKFKMKKISMLELRQRARAMIRGLDRGESYTLTYRGRAVGEITPFRKDTEPSPEDPIYQLGDLAENGNGKRGLTNEAADKLIYG